MKNIFVLYRCEVVFIWLEIVCGESIGPLNLMTKNLMISKQDYCLREATCQNLNNFTCFGITLPYTKTTNQFTGLSQNETLDILNKWKALQSVPKCWAVVQPLLCAIYLPKCENGFVTLPSQEMCNVTRGPCRVVAREQNWPSYLLCENESLFPSGCKNDLRELKFNTTAHCASPLVETRFTESWIEGIEGCGLKCYNPSFTADEHHKIHVSIAVSASFCLIANLFSIVTFLIDWKNANKYPAVVIFYINICFLINCVGWLAQFTPGARRNIVCHQDGTFRQGEPRNGSNLSCIIVFILIYYSLMASIVWFVILAYTWNISFRSVNLPREVTEGKAAYFHMVAWSLPLILTITIMALSEVDGSSIYGICFVGCINQSARGGFLLVPVAIATITGVYFLIQGLITLIKVKIKSGDVIKNNINIKIQNMIIRIAIFTFLCLLFVSFAFGCHIYEYNHQHEWKNSLWKYIVCSAKKAVETHGSEMVCSVKNRMSLLVIYLYLISVFGTGILMSSWVWTTSCIDAWKRFFYRVFNQPINEPVRLKRSKMIAKVFAQKQISQGPFSVSFHSTHDDPVGMNFELNSIASQELSSTWAAAFPKFISRRGAIVGGSSIGIRHHSSLSDISQQQFSIDSCGGRRQSLDSQLSMQVSEQEWIAHALARHQRRKTRRERERLIRTRNRIIPWIPSRRGSDTSQHSIAARRLTAEKVMITRATSTGDLTQGVLFHRPTTSLFITRPLVQKQIINPPFTHGMTDNSHKGNAEIKTQYNNNISNTLFQQIGMPLYHPNYDVASSHVNVFGDVYLPQKIDTYTYLPGSVCYPQYTYVPLNYFSDTNASLNHEPLIPLHPMIDTSSEVEYLPIRISDTSDFYTDGDYLSPDETQILSAQRLVQKHQMSEYILPFPREFPNNDNSRNLQSMKRSVINLENKTGLQDIAELSERGSSAPRSGSVLLMSQTPHKSKQIISENLDH